MTSLLARSLRLSVLSCSTLASSAYAVSGSYAILVIGYVNVERGSGIGSIALCAVGRDGHANIQGFAPGTWICLI